MDSAEQLLEPTWEGTLEGRIAGLLQTGERVVLVTVVASEGSAPRHAGTRALQLAQGFEGTVGGGKLEAGAMAAARQALQRNEALRTTVEMQANADEDMICGGKMEVLCEPLVPGQAPLFALADQALRQGIAGVWLLKLGGGAPRRELLLAEQPEGEGLLSGCTPGAEQVGALLQTTRRRPGLMTADGRENYVEPLSAPPILFLCGGGHVALEVARLAHNCGFVVEVADDREEFANPGRFPMARRCHVLPGFQGLSACGIERGHFVAIMTRGHAFDREALEQTLACRPRYLGMIGSKTKREQVYAKLQAAGVSAEDLASVCCPIGLSVFAETPQQIAVSVVAELLSVLSGTLPVLRPGR